LIEKISLQGNLPGHSSFLIFFLFNFAAYNILAASNFFVINWIARSERFYI